MEGNSRVTNPSPYALTRERDFQSFADSARTLAGLAGVLLGWRPDEFWRSTPAELAAVFAALAPDAGESVSTADLARLMEMFPD